MSRLQGNNSSGRKGGRSSDTNRSSSSKPSGRSGAAPKRTSSGESKTGAKSFRPASKTSGGSGFGAKSGSDRSFSKSGPASKPARSFSKPGAEKGTGKTLRKTDSAPKTGRSFSKPDAEKGTGKTIRKADFGAKSGGRSFDKKETPRSRESVSYTGKRDASASPRKRITFSESDHMKKRAAAALPKSDQVASGIRLNKFIANSGLCSRREADVFIQNGVVTINGKMVDELGYKVQPGDVVKFDDRTIIPEKPAYLLLNKPKDYITTGEDPQGRKTVMALIEGACKERVFPVGRLDRNTTGLLLFTNDGEMADKLTHPRKRVKKIYMAELDKNFKVDHMNTLREGIVLEDGPIKPDAVEFAEAGNKRLIGIEIHSGRNRIVRRMFEHFGYTVVKLDRVYFAGLTKKNLPRGHYRLLEPIEVSMLKML